MRRHTLLMSRQLVGKCPDWISLSTIYDRSGHSTVRRSHVPGTNDAPDHSQADDGSFMPTWWECHRCQARRATGHGAGPHHAPRHALRHATGHGAGPRHAPRHAPAPRRRPSSRRCHSPPPPLPWPLVHLQLPPVRPDQPPATTEDGAPKGRFVRAAGSTFRPPRYDPETTPTDAPSEVSR